MQVGSLSRRFRGLMGRLQKPCWVAGGWACRELGQILQVRLPEAAVTPYPALSPTRCLSRSELSFPRSLSRRAAQAPFPASRSHQSAASVCSGHNAILMPGASSAGLSAREMCISRQRWSPSSPSLVILNL